MWIKLQLGDTGKIWVSWNGGNMEGEMRRGVRREALEEKGVIGKGWEWVGVTGVGWVLAGQMTRCNMLDLVEFHRILLGIVLCLLISIFTIAQQILKTRLKQTTFLSLDVATQWPIILFIESAFLSKTLFTLTETALLLWRNSIKLMLFRISILKDKVLFTAIHITFSIAADTLYANSIPGSLSHCYCYWIPSFSPIISRIPPICSSARIVVCSSQKWREWSEFSPRCVMEC